MGFGNSRGTSGKGRGAIERTFAPEFRNRLDAWIAFEPLSFETTEHVVDKFIDELRAQLAPKNVTLELTRAGPRLAGEERLRHAPSARARWRA